ncbi:hypothetical protein ABW20_dc0110232 [Dactylellina cionopaga]|nr:hypothetical protein ABW20_dc0110232 [Dactylellina cionopaga]
MIAKKILGRRSSRQSPEWMRLEGYLSIQSVNAADTPSPLSSSASRLFQKWVEATPPEDENRLDGVIGARSDQIHPKFHFYQNYRRLPKRVYWREGIDGTSDEWTEWTDDHQGYDPVCTFPESGGAEDHSDSESENETAEGNESENEIAEGNESGNETADDNDGDGGHRGTKRRRESEDTSNDVSMDDAPDERTSYSKIRNHWNSNV